MSLIAEIEKFMNTANSSINYRVINSGGKSLYVEGIKGVVDLGENEIKLQLKKVMLIVSGNNFKIKYLDKTTCIIDGEIVSVVTK